MPMLSKRVWAGNNFIEQFVKKCSNSKVQVERPKQKTKKKQRQKTKKKNKKTGVLEQRKTCLNWFIFRKQVMKYT